MSDNNTFAWHSHNPVSSHTHTISMTPAWGIIEPERKGPKLSTLEKVRAERAEARERLRVEAAYREFDEADLDSSESGTVLRFSWSPEGSERVYEYAALFTGGKWFVTGRESPNGLATEDFVAWLIGKDVGLDDLVELRAA